MRHLKSNRKFGRKKDKRRAFIKSLISNLILKEKITTTEARAKEIKTKSEKLITLAKKQNDAAFRLLLSRLPEKAAEKIFKTIALRCKNRSGGYTRIIKTSAFRKRDGAQMVIIELV